MKQNDNYQQAYLRRSQGAWNHYNERCLNCHNHDPR